MDLEKPGIPPGAKLVFKGILFDVYQWEQKMFDGSLATFEKLKRDDSAVVIPVVGDQILIEEQLQPDWSAPRLTLVSGRCEKGEDPLAAAKREMLEETGYVSDDWELWKQFRPLSKIVWSAHYFIARNCRKVAEQKLEAGEKITLKPVSFDEFLMLSEKETFRGFELTPVVYRMRLYPEEKEQFRKLLFGA